MKLLLIEVVNPRRRQDLNLSTGLGYISAYLRRDLPSITRPRTALGVAAAAAVPDGG